MTDGGEKRKHIRLSAMGPVEVVAQGGAVREGYLASIGRGGIGLYLAEPVPAGQLLLVKLRLAASGGDDAELKVATRVRWTRAAGRLHMTGLAFEQMSDARYATLLRHMNVIEIRQLGQRGQERPEAKVRFTIKE